MTVQIYDYVNVKDQILKLGCNEPTGIAILPRNFETANSKQALINESSVPTVRILLRNAGISETKIEPKGDKIPQIAEKAFIGWIGPTIFVSAAIINQNANILTIALNIISAYLYDWFKGITGEKKVKLNIVTDTKSGNFKRIQYEGDIDGLKELPKIIREIHK